MNIFFLLAIALAPGAAIGLYIYWKDKHEREPLGLLVKSFFFGVISTLITLLISWPISRLVPLDPTSVTQQAVHAFLLVALIEEFSKFIFVRWVLYPNKNFNEPFDGIVYSLTVSLGFAGLENILYVMDGGMETAILRMFTAVPAHASFGVLMGYFLGKAKFEHKKAHYAIYALGVATLFHGAYDYFWFISYVPGIWIGAVISLIIGIVLSRRAIHIHQQASPFIGRASEEDLG
ncbi:MAG: PrsW family intramembrane metalloprotease [Cytophagales bacterium]|jgi:RsiW-degrading membrane proteinase PrsW (M82 family)|nr:PrsW family intramembrane metalloprotease [Cytophagales bacterium]MCA6386681.1 PrsW family intramembrane metalloprotease [Cytophagales bacterium]MCA6392436.1 PrsW family intramembrane metalloprotease [Cytophagales bacterium]MCA6394176.1 PrsW family intramembrane metalloprotease [Cytophagales bacterium]MCA6400047.1 PrsW family intramembrane metalloprotease [Cytophagales bacterium]